MSTDDPAPSPGRAQLLQFVRVTNAAAMMRAVIDAPGLTDYQRMFGQGVVWSRLLGPALEEIEGYDIALIRASLDVAEAASSFRDAGTDDPGGLEGALEELDGALNRLELLDPTAQIAQAARTDEFLEMLRAVVDTGG